MHAVIMILLAITLSMIVVQDFRSRLISWYLVPVLLVLFGWSAMRAVSFYDAGVFFLVNIAFVALQMLMISLYFGLKNKRPVNIIDTWLGIGDILLLVALCAAFSPVNFLLFYLLSLLLTIAGYLIYKLMKGRSSTIPLAGAVALLLLLCLLYQRLSPQVNFYDDGPALQFLHLNP